MKSLLIALQFLTVIPVRVRKINNSDFGRAAAFFPLVGLLLGAVLFLVYKLLVLSGFGVFFISAGLAVAAAFLTGALHLDGLSDTFDGLMSGKDRERMLEIMRDSHSGVMGTVAVISVMLLKTALFSQLMPGNAARMLLLSGLYSRFMLTGSLFLFSNARPEGKAKLFKENITGRLFALSFAGTFTAGVLIAGLAALPVFILVGLAAYGFNVFVRKKLGGFTGDTLGAVCELSEVFILAVFVMVK